MVALPIAFPLATAGADAKPLAPESYALGIRDSSHRALNVATVRHDGVAACFGAKVLAMVVAVEDLATLHVSKRSPEAIDPASPAILVVLSAFFVATVIGDLLAQQMRKLDRILQGIALVRRDLKSGPVDHAVAVAAGDAGAADALGRRPRARSAHSGFTRTRPATVTTRPTLGIHHVRLAGVLAALCLHLGHLAGGGGGGWIVQGQLE